MANAWRLGVSEWVAPSLERMRARPGSAREGPHRRLIPRLRGRVAPGGREAASREPPWRAPERASAAGRKRARRYARRALLTLASQDPQHSSLLCAREPGVAGDRTRKSRRSRDFRRRGPGGPPGAGPGAARGPSARGEGPGRTKKPTPEVSLGGRLLLSRGTGRHERRPGTPLLRCLGPAAPGRSTRRQRPTLTWGEPRVPLPSARRRQPRVRRDRTGVARAAGRSSVRAFGACSRPPRPRPRRACGSSAGSKNASALAAAQEGSEEPGNDTIFECFPGSHRHGSLRSPRVRGDATAPQPRPKIEIVCSLRMSVVSVQRISAVSVFTAVMLNW